MQEWLIENKIDGSILLLVPGGEFLAGKDRFPVVLPPYYLGMYPISRSQYHQFLGATCYAETGGFTRDRKSGRYVANYPIRPDQLVANITWRDALAYCEWSGLRLPTELEFEKAALGTDGRQYPWGSRWNPIRLPREYDGAPSGGSRARSLAEHCGPWGHYQLTGYIWQWCSDWYDSECYDRYQEGDLSTPGSGTRRVVRGGSDQDPNPDFLRGDLRNSRSPETSDLSCGFRVALTCIPQTTASR